jgi:hypothetical protein
MTADLPRPDIMHFNVMFDEKNPNWHNHRGYNQMYLAAQLHHLNACLERKPFVTINDVFEALGFERISEGMVHGWLRGEKIDLVLDYPDQDETPVVLAFATTNIYKRLRRGN